MIDMIAKTLQEFLLVVGRVVSCLVSRRPRPVNPRRTDVPGAVRYRGTPARRTTYSTSSIVKYEYCLIVTAYDLRQHC